MSSSSDQLCVDNHTFPILQGWLVLVPFMLVQGRCSSYYSMLQSHILSRSPDAALCSLQPFKDNNAHCGVRFYHRNCCHVCSKHLQMSVSDCQWYSAETDCYLDVSSHRSFIRRRYRYIYRFFCRLGLWTSITFPCSVGRHSVLQMFPPSNPEWSSTS